MADDDVENFFVFHSDFVASLLLTSRNEKCPTYTNCTTKGFLDPVLKGMEQKIPNILASVTYVSTAKKK